MQITAPTINNGDPIDPTVVQAFVNQVDVLRRGSVDHDNLKTAKPWAVAPLKGWYLGGDDGMQPNPPPGPWTPTFVPIPASPDYLLIPFRLAPQSVRQTVPKDKYKIANVLVTADAWSANEELQVRLYKFSDETYNIGTALLLMACTIDSGAIVGTNKLVSGWLETFGVPPEQYVDCEASYEFFAWHIRSTALESGAPALWRSVSIQGEVWYYPFEG